VGHSYHIPVKYAAIRETSRHVRIVASQTGRVFGLSVRSFRNISAKVDRNGYGQSVEQPPKLSIECKG